MMEEILKLCHSLGAGEGEDELLRPLAQAAQQKLTGRLRPGVSPQNCGSAFPLAAAMLAVEGLERTAGTRQVEDFTAGDITLRMRGGGDGGLSAQAERLLEPWLRDRGSFSFQGVRG